MVDTVVPVNDEAEFLRNPLGSPGLQELGGFIVPVHEATSAADAWERGLGRSSAPWVIFCHQDVWFPPGSGAAIASVLRKVPLRMQPYSLYGVVGVGWKDGQPYWAGTVVDRGRLLDWPDADCAVSLDELCIIMHRSCRYKIDARLGWHLWATDLCLQASEQGHHAKIIRALLHHNSTLTGIPADFYCSAKYLHEKYPEHAVFHTLNGFL